jgi:biopolymer transport protein TolR
MSTSTGPSPLGRLRAQAGPTPMNEINVTPLVDVMLVLLVIFMVTAPLVAAHLRINLPAVPGAVKPKENVLPPLRLSLDAKGQVFFNDQAIKPAFLGPLLARAARNNPQTEVHLRVDQAVAYGKMVQLLGQLQTVGLNQVHFIVQSQGDSPAPPVLAPSEDKPSVQTHAFITP